MPLPDLLLGTRRLRRDADAHLLQLERDVMRVKLASAQLRHTTVARMTSPIGLLSAAGVGFLAGRFAGRPAQPKQPEHASHSEHRPFSDMAAHAISVARSMGLQILLPIAAGWLQSKLSNEKDYPANEENNGAHIQ